MSGSLPGPRLVQWSRMDPTSADTRRLLRLDEVAQRLSVSRRHVERLLARSEIRSVRLGRRRLIAEADLAAYVDQLRAANP